MSKTVVVAEPGKQAITVTRVFDAPPALVYRTYVEPDLVGQWLRPQRLTMTIEQWDARPGGSWRYVHRDAEGHAYGFHGVFHAVEAPERLVQTFEFEGAPGHVSLDTATFAAQGGQTLLTLHSVYQSVEDRDAMIASGMESGLTEALDSLEKLIAELQRGVVPAR